MGLMFELGFKFSVFVYSLLLLPQYLESLYGVLVLLCGCWCRILLKRRELILHFNCDLAVCVLYLFLTVPCVSLQSCDCGIFWSYLVSFDSTKNEP